MATLTRRSLTSAAALAALTPLILPSGAWAQAQPQAPATPPTRVRGTIAALDGNRLTVTTREGAPVTITLGEPLTVSALRRVELSSIAPGSYVGTATEPGPDGELRALEVLVFPEAARGSGEGHYAWDLSPGTSMTNATVTAAVERAAGRELSLTYRGGSVRVQVPPDVPVVTPIPAARDDLKPGARVFVVAARDAAGQLTANRLVVGKDGVDPPM